MRIVVFGASGRTGSLVVTQALDRGHDAVAVVRPGSSASFDGRVRAVIGDPGNAGVVEEAVRGADAVVSVLGPVAGVTTTEISDATRTIVDVMERTGPARLVVAANGRIFDDDPATGEYANVTGEHRRNARIVRSSGLAWSLVAAPYLKDDLPAGPYEVAVDGKALGRSIGRASFATALLDALERDDWAGHAVGVSG